MRLHIPTLGLATGLFTIAIATGGTGSTGATPAVSVNNDDNSLTTSLAFGQGNLVFSSTTWGNNASIPYHSDAGVTFVQLCRWEDRKCFFDDSLSSGSPAGAGAKRQTGDKDLTLAADHVYTAICSAGQNKNGLCDQILYLEFTYGEDDLKAYSPAFALTKTPDTTSYGQLIQQFEELPDFPNPITSAPSSTTKPLPSGLPPVSATDSAGTTNPTGSSGSDEGSTDAGASGHSASDAPSGGLSTGAVAGIAVACAVVGIAAIGLGIFFCIRRRKATAADNTRDINASYGSDAGMRGIVTEKVDANGFSQSSPQSAFADDGGRLHDRGNPAAYDQHSSASYPMYAEGGAAAMPHNSQSDLRQANEVRSQEFTTSRSATGSTTAGMQSPSPPASARYAHLVEEGMTPDEIERLEEEERQLDMAIQEAGERRQRQ